MSEARRWDNPSNYHECSHLYDHQAVVYDVDRAVWVFGQKGYPLDTGVIVDQCPACHGELK